MGSTRESPEALLEEYERRLRPSALGAGGLLALGSLCGLASLGALALACGRFFHAGPSPGLSDPLLWGAAGGFLFLRMVLGVAAGAWGERSASRLMEEVRGRLVDAASRQDPGNGGRFASLLGPVLDKLHPFASRAEISRIHGVLGPVAILIALACVDWPSAALLALLAILIPVFLPLLGRLAREKSELQSNALLRLSASFSDRLGGLATLVQFDRLFAVGEKVRSDGRDFAEKTMAVLRVAFLSSLVLELIVTLSTAALAVESGLRLLYGRIGIEAALFSILAAPEFFAPLRALGTRHHSVQDAKAAMVVLLEFLGEPRPSSTAREIVLDGRWPLRVEGLGFRFPAAPDLLFRDVRFSIERGERVGLRGRSGEGKSTLGRILLGLEMPVGSTLHGEISRGGVPFSESIRESWQGAATWVSQDPRTFFGTLREQLLLANPEADDHALLEAIDHSGFREVLDRLPRGLDQDLGQGSVRLSGGERQRLALARALLRRTDFLLLDEPTAHLDAEAEESFLSGLSAWGKDRTILVISHRSAVLDRMDRLLHLEAGNLREEGRP